MAPRESPRNRFATEDVPTLLALRASGPGRTREGSRGRPRKNSSYQLRQPRYTPGGPASRLLADAHREDRGLNPPPTPGPFNPRRNPRNLGRLRKERIRALAQQPLRCPGIGRREIPMPRTKALSVSKPSRRSSHSPLLRPHRGPGLEARISFPGRLPIFARELVRANESQV